MPRLSALSDDSPGPNEVDLLERLLQLYELCLHYAGHRDHNVVSHALETLLQLLRQAITEQIVVLTLTGRHLG